MKMIDGLTDNSLRTLTVIKLSANIVPPREDDVADMLAQYRADVDADEAYMDDVEYRDILGIN